MSAAEHEVRESAGNPFAAPVKAAAAASNAAGEAATQREFAEIQAAMVIAQKFPRDPRVAMDRVLMACSRPTLAEAALYSYARGGSEVTGPSIRLAEALAQSWGNLQFGIRELDQRGAGAVIGKSGESTVEAYAWDLETNTKQVKVFQVPHVRHTKNGSKALTDPRDIYEMVANQGARRLRACILGVIPGDVIDAAVNQCEVTLKASADVSPEAQAKMLAKFAEIGVTREQIEKRIQRRIESITPALILGLRKIYNSISDGMSAAGDWFEGAATASSAPTTASQAAKDKLRATAKPEDKPEAPAATPSADLAALESNLRAAKSQGALKAEWEAIRAQLGGEIPVQLEAAFNETFEALAVKK